LIRLIDKGIDHFSVKRVDLIVAYGILSHIKQ
jgi:hypothetical protein